MSAKEPKGLDILATDEEMADYWRARALHEDKRLSDAEAAAEYWKAREEATDRRARVDKGVTSFQGMSADEAEAFAEIALRFAVCPHFDGRAVR